MAETVEPIEAAIVAFALLWTALALGLLWRWVGVWQTAERRPKPMIARKLVAIRLIGHTAGLLVALIVLAAGVVAAATPRPSGPSLWREWFQVGWLLIASSKVAATGAIEWLTSSVLGDLEDSE